MTGAPPIPHSHAAHYRVQAERFRQMAAVEPNEVNPRLAAESVELTPLNRTRDGLGLNVLARGSVAQSGVRVNAML